MIDRLVGCTLDVISRPDLRNSPLDASAWVEAMGFAWESVKLLRANRGNVTNSRTNVGRELMRESLLYGQLTCPNALNIIVERKQFRFWGWAVKSWGVWEVSRSRFQSLGFGVWGEGFSV